MHVKYILYAIVLFIISCAILSYEFKSCCDNSFYFILFIQSRCILLGPLEDWYYVLKGLPILLYILPDILIFFIVMYIYSNKCYLILSYLIHSHLLVDKPFSVRFGQNLHKIHINNFPDL